MHATISDIENNCGNCIVLSPRHYKDGPWINGCLWGTCDVLSLCQACTQFNLEFYNPAGLMEPTSGQKTSQRFQRTTASLWPQSLFMKDRSWALKFSFHWPSYTHKSAPLKNVLLNPHDLTPLHPYLPS